MSHTTTPLAPFIWNRNYDDYAQIEPYYPGYLAIRNELDANGQFPYDDLFKGRIEGVAGSPNEDTAIYLLQQHHRRTQDAAQAEEFIAQGAKPLAEYEPGIIMRGDLARRGWYMGGTGWEVLTDARVTIRTTADGTPRDVLFKLPGQRTWRTHSLSVGKYLFRQTS